MLSFRELFRPIYGREEHLSLRSFVKRFEYNNSYDEFEPIDLNPDYQRDYVWSDRQAELFVGYRLEGGKSFPVLINRDEDFTKGFYLKDEVVDGKQRLTSLVRWVNGEIAAELSDGSRVYFKDFNQDDQNIILGMSGLAVHVMYVSYSRKEILNLYLKLNRGGTVHTEEEINKVRQMIAEIAKEK